MDATATAPPETEKTAPAARAEPAPPPGSAPQTDKKPVEVQPAVRPPDAPPQAASAPVAAAPEPVSPEARMLRVWPGQSYPLGATWDGAGVNFALYAEN